MQRWTPTPRQTDALRISPTTAFEILFGGSRGGGKTETGLAWLSRAVGHSRYRALVIRHEAKDLVDWLDRARRFYAGTGGVVVGQPAEVRFPSGAIIRTGHLGDANAYQQYQGHEYQRILIEELTQIPMEDQYLRLLSSCRSTIPELRPQVMTNANPDGPGFSWVKRRWQIEGAPDAIIKTTDAITGLSRVFIPSRVQDNPYLMHDTKYLAWLNGLPDGLREAWRDGSWSEPQIAGAYYTLALSQARRENRIKLIPYDPTLLVHTVWDLGIGEQLVCGFFQRLPSEMRLIDTWQGKENNGLPEAAVMLAEKKYRYGIHFAPHDANKTETGTGQTITQQAKKVGIAFERIPMIGIADGINKTLQMFPRLYISENKCERAIDAIRQYRRQWDEQRLDWRPEPHKDWTCFTGDTRVLTRYGTYPIMELPATGEILTPFGWQKYENPKKTRLNVRIVEVSFKDGTKVRCTPEHLFLTEKGWKSAENLQRDTAILSSLTFLRSILMAGYIGFSPARSIIQEEVKNFIAMCGNVLLDNYRYIATSITKILTPPITLLKILNVCQNLNIAEYQKYAMPGFHNLQEKEHQSGINQNKEDYGIQEWQNALNLGKSGKEKKRNVLYAEHNLMRLSEKMDMPKNGVIPTARRLLIECVRMLDNKEDVWDLCVPDVHCFSLENGAVVHNSHLADMLRYAALVEDKMTNEEYNLYGYTQRSITSDYNPAV